MRGRGVGVETGGREEGSAKGGLAGSFEGLRVGDYTLGTGVRVVDCVGDVVVVCSDAGRHGWFGGWFWRGGIGGGGGGGESVFWMVGERGFVVVVVDELVEFFLGCGHCEEKRKRREEEEEGNIKMGRSKYR